jgi:hypothetical protein
LNIGKEELKVKPKKLQDIKEGMRPLMPKGVKDKGLWSLFDELGQGVHP